MAVYNPSGAGNVHVDKILTQISIGFPNQGLVGDSLFPTVTVQKQSDKYYIFGREQFSPEVSDFRAPGTIANEVPGLAVSTDTYYAQEHALQIPVSDEERANADSPLSPDRDATELVTSRILLGREYQIMTRATTSGNYSSGYSVALTNGTTSWDVYATSDPINDMRTGTRKVMAGLFVEPNTAVIPYPIMSYLEDHPDFLERIKYSERAIFSPELLQAILGFNKVVVPGVGYNSANLGQPVALNYLWPKSVVLAYVPPRPGLKIPAYGYEFAWGAQMVDRWREEQRRSDLLRVARRYDLKLTALDASGLSNAGYLITSVIS
jgi:hypothetical protein